MQQPQGTNGIIEGMRLYIPLDVHVGYAARELGLLQRANSDRKAVEQLTAKLREFCPENPVKYNFALFGSEVNKNIFPIFFARS